MCPDLVGVVAAYAARAVRGLLPGRLGRWCLLSWHILSRAMSNLEATITHGSLEINTEVQYTLAQQIENGL